MYKNKKGQMFVSLISLILGIIIYLFAIPILFEIIQSVVPMMGTATAFVVKLFLWLIMIVLVTLLVRLVNSEGNFF